MRNGKGDATLGFNELLIHQCFPPSLFIVIVNTHLSYQKYECLHLERGQEKCSCVRSAADDSVQSRPAPRRSWHQAAVGDRSSMPGYNTERIAEEYTVSPVTRN